jgi:hypothetical protein
MKTSVFLRLLTIDGKYLNLSFVTGFCIATSLAVASVFGGTRFAAASLAFAGCTLLVGCRMGLLWMASYDLAIALFAKDLLYRNAVAIHETDGRTQAAAEELDRRQDDLARMVGLGRGTKIN